MNYSPFEQFEVKLLSNIALLGLDLSVTNLISFLVLAHLLLIFFFTGIVKERKYIASHWQAVVKSIYLFVVSLVKEQSGKKGIKFFLFFFTIFCLILIMNTVVLLPFSFTVTSHIIIMISLVLSFVFCWIILCYIWSGFKKACKLLQEFLSSFLILTLFYLSFSATSSLLSYLYFWYFRTKALSNAALLEANVSNTKLILFLGLASLLLGCLLFLPKNLIEIKNIARNLQAIYYYRVFVSLNQLKELENIAVLNAAKFFFLFRLVTIVAFIFFNTESLLTYVFCQEDPSDLLGELFAKLFLRLSVLLLVLLVVKYTQSFFTNLADVNKAKKIKIMKLYFYSLGFIEITGYAYALYLLEYSWFFSVFIYAGYAIFIFLFEHFKVFELFVQKLKAFSESKMANNVADKINLILDPIILLIVIIQAKVFQNSGNLIYVLKIAFFVALFNYYNLIYVWLFSFLIVGFISNLFLKKYKNDLVFHERISRKLEIRENNKTVNYSNINSLVQILSRRNFVVAAKTLASGAANSTHTTSLVTSALAILTLGYFDYKGGEILRAKNDGCFAEMHNEERLRINAANSKGVYSNITLPSPRYPHLLREPSQIAKMAVGAEATAKQVIHVSVGTVKLITDVLEGKTK